MVSILMPVKNAGRFLIPCIESIIEQDMNDWELVAVNDHSTDESEKILHDFSEKDQRIVVHQNKGEGIIEALRTAYELSKGDVIHRMDADDLMPSYKLRVMLDALEKGSVVTGKVKYFSDDWLVGLGFQNYESWINGLVESGEQYVDIYKECPIPSPVWMIEREEFNRIGAFRSDLLPEDYDLCFRMYQHDLKVIGLDMVLHYWRDSQNRTSRKDPTYFPMAYYPLKLFYFFELERDVTKRLILWGAGKKGKRMAQWMNERDHDFIWITDNDSKQGLEIHGKELYSPDEVNLTGSQTILAMASPDDQKKVQEKLDRLELAPAHDYYWFC